MDDKFSSVVQASYAGKQRLASIPQGKHLIGCILLDGYMQDVCMHVCTCDSITLPNMHFKTQCHVYLSHMHGYFIHSLSQHHMYKRHVV